VHIDAVFAAIGRFSVRFRWLMLVAWVAGAVAAVALLPALSSVSQSNNTKFLPSSAPSMHAATLAAPFGATNLQAVPVVAARQGGTLTAADVAALTALQGKLRTVATVDTVKDLGRSPDGQAEELLVLARFAGGQNGQTDLVNSLRARIASAGLPSGLQAHLAGAIADQVDNQAKSGSTGNQIQNLSALFIIVLLLLVFRALLAPLLTLAPAFLAVLISGPLVAEAAQHGLKVSVIAQFLLIVLVLGAGTDYGLFLVFRTREELRGGLAPRDAVVKAITRVGESITFSAGTVVAALLTLLVASFEFYSDLGIPLAIGIGVMLAAGLTLLPALLAIFGRAAFWPSKTTGGAGRPGLWGEIAGRIVRRPAVTLTVGVVFFGALASASAGYMAAGFGGTTSSSAGTDSAAGDSLLARHFPQSSSNPTNLIFVLRSPAWADSAPLTAAANKLRASGLFTTVTGPLNPAGAALTPGQLATLHATLGPAKALPPTPPAGADVPRGIYQAYRATANYVSPDGRTIQFLVGLKAGDPGGTKALNAVPAIRSQTAAVAKAIGAADSGVGGQAPAIYDISSTSNSDLSRVIPLAIVAIGILLALVMRSLVAPLYLIASVALSYFAALGLAVLLFIDLGSSGGLIFFLPFLMFVFLLALGEDYNILVMTRIREEVHTYPLREAVTRALSATGTTVTSAGLVLAGTFGVFAFVGSRGNESSQLRDIGFGLALGILMDTFLVRTLLVPSTVVLLGRWNWWPSQLGRAGTPEAGRTPADHVTSVAAAAVPDQRSPGDKVW